MYGKISLDPEHREGEYGISFRDHLYRTHGYMGEVFKMVPIIGHVYGMVCPTTIGGLPVIEGHMGGISHHTQYVTSYQFNTGGVYEVD